LRALASDGGRRREGIIGIEGERPRDRALRICGRQPVRIEQPGLRAIVEVGDLHQRLLGCGTINDVAAGEERERTEARPATQKQPARRVPHDLGLIFDQELRVDARDHFADARHDILLIEWRMALAANRYPLRRTMRYRPMIMARNDFGTTKAMIT